MRATKTDSCPQFRVLYTSEDVFREVRSLFSNPKPRERRAALVAYLGLDAPKYLLSPSKLRVICALQPSATSADAISTLLEQGATVEQSPRLHMKVYWSSHRGCVICSANASRNALGHRGLLEAGVWLPGGSVDIDRLIKEADAKTIQPSDIERLRHESDRDHSPYQGGVRAGPPRSFTEWHATYGRRSWRLGWHTDRATSVSRNAKKYAAHNYFEPSPYDFLSVSKSEADAGDWLLCFDVATGKHLRWMYVDFVVSVNKSEKKSYDRAHPRQAVQVHQPKYYPTPPFSLQNGFRAAFASTMVEFGQEYLKRVHNARPPNELINHLLQKLKMK